MSHCTGPPFGDLIRDLTDETSLMVISSRKSSHHSRHRLILPSPYFAFFFPLLKVFSTHYDKKSKRCLDMTITMKQ